ncbi:hypothetical protein CSW59_10255 [Caulobacter sp. BP25]|nr:formylglycine-generating enzyme family protein [Caulobacter sp. BP25]PHY19431.1 hypothetical protein CSW59_10255 [Caulobacter sp. BP25]
MTFSPRSALAGLAAWIVTAACGVANAQTASQPFRDCDAVCPELVAVPAGTFVMGSSAKEKGRGPDEGPTHKVTIARPFAVGRFEVTFDEWDACVAAGGCKATDNGTAVASDAGWGRGRRPVINVSWRDAHDYGAWLSAKTGKPYRLLSEAEWEYAARAGGRSTFADGEQISPSAANFKDSGTNATVPVGGYAPNRFGIYDMAGNVWEWVEDCFTLTYDTAPADGGANAGGDCGRRMLRGGGWNTPDNFLRPAARGRNKVDFRDNDFGFRIARDLP